MNDVSGAPAAGALLFAVPSSRWSEAEAAGKSPEDLLLYRSNLNLSQAIETIEAEVETSEERDYLLAFLSNIRRGYSGRQNDPNKPRPEEL